MKFQKLLVAAVSTAFLAACGGGDTAVSPSLTLTSTSFTNGGVIPVKYASTLWTGVGGQNISPALAITNVPAGTASFAVVMDDETAPCLTGAGACVHWNVFNLPATKVTIAESENLSTISGVVVGTNNTANTQAYDGPHPPNNHTYNLTVYALNSTAATVVAPATYTRSQFETAFSGKILEKVTLTGRFPQ